MRFPFSLKIHLELQNYCGSTNIFVELVHLFLIRQYTQVSWTAFAGILIKLVSPL